MCSVVQFFELKGLIWQLKDWLRNHFPFTAGRMSHSHVNQERDNLKTRVFEGLGACVYVCVVDNHSCVDWILCGLVEFSVIILKAPWRFLWLYYSKFADGNVWTLWHELFSYFEVPPRPARVVDTCHNLLGASGPAVPALLEPHGVEPITVTSKPRFLWYSGSQSIYCSTVAVNFTVVHLQLDAVMIVKYFTALSHWNIEEFLCTLFLQ